MTPARDAYGAVARLYDLHGWDWYASTYGDRLLTLLRERGVAPGASVLDAGCGTGTLALRLAREGYRVTGVDLSPAMIDRAVAKDGSGSVAWRRGDLTALDLGATFDAVVSVADVFNHLDTLDRWEAALAAIRAHLNPGGVAFVDAMTCRGLEQMDLQSVQERGGITLILAIVYESRARRSTLKVTSFTPSPAADGLYERTQETITEWGQPVAGILERCARGGFGRAERVWATSDDPESDDRVSILAWR